MLASELQELSLLDLDHKHGVASTGVRVHLRERSGAVFLANRECVHALLGRFDGYPLEAGHKDPRGWVLSDLDLAAVLLRVDQVLHHLHVDLYEGAGDLEVVALAGLHLLDLFKQVLQGARYYAPLFIRERTVRAHHRVGLARAGLSIGKYRPVEAVDHSL